MTYAKTVGKFTSLGLIRFYARNAGKSGRASPQNGEISENLGETQEASKKRNRKEAALFESRFSGEVYREHYGRPLYGWHISDLKIYDEPRRVEEFWHFGVKRGAKVTRPPQSWCYVESITDDYAK